MVGDHHVGAAFNGLVDDGGDRVDGQKDGSNGLGGIAAYELVGVPGLGELGRGRGTQHGDDVGHAQRRGGGDFGLAHE